MTDSAIRASVRKIIHANMISGYSKSTNVHYHFTKPSPGTYPFQFFWDTCFHVYILTAIGEHEMAKKHIISLFALQEENGFVGHMIYWDRKWPGRITDFFQSKPGQTFNLFRSHMSALIQPPLVAQAVERIYHTTGDRTFLVEMLPKLKRYYQWLATNRDFDGDGLLTIISPFESGMDWKPAFDPVVGLSSKRATWRLFLRMIAVDTKNFIHNYHLPTIYQKGYFLVKEVGFNTVYAQNLQAMAALCQAAGDPDSEKFSALAWKVTQSILALMYSDESAAFFDVFGKSNRQIPILTPTVFFPLVLKGVPKELAEKVIEAHFFNRQEFATPFPLPSVAINHPSYNPGESLYIWRGPTWIVYNWFMHQFLMEKGFRKEASHLVVSIKELIRKSGFREYYHPFTGEGYGAHDFTWAGLVVDMMNMEQAKSPSTGTLYTGEGPANSSTYSSY